MIDDELTRRVKRYLLNPTFADAARLVRDLQIDRERLHERHVRLDARIERLQRLVDEVQRYPLGAKLE